MNLADTVEINAKPIKLSALPKGIVARESLGLVTHQRVDGKLLYASPKGLFEVKGTITPGGDWLIMFPEGLHYASQTTKVNDLMAMRSSDRGKTWTAPAPAFKIDYNQHGFVPLIPRGSKRIYSFGTQPVWDKFSIKDGQGENAPIGYRWSDDDGKTWSDVKLIEPVNDAGYRGMSVMRMCETDARTWIIGSHYGDWSKKPLITRQYLLRSEDQGRTWTLLPDKHPNGWFADGFSRMDEGRPINLGGGRVLTMFRTPAGKLSAAWSDDDGKTWTKPAPSPLVHPDAPPMLYHLSDGKTLIAFHHNRHSQRQYTGLDGKMKGMLDRSEIWAATSSNGGRTWSAPRFVFANALAPDPKKTGWHNAQCSYLDMFLDGDVLNIFVPHRWQRVLHLQLREADLGALPTAEDLGKP